MTERIVVGSDGHKYITNEPEPQREWQSLTDEEITDALINRPPSKRLSHLDAARAIEAKLREKNT